MIRTVLLILFLPFAALAQDIPTPLSDQVSDFANLLDAEAEARVAQTLQSAREETGVHIALVTIPAMSDYGAKRLPDLAKTWFNSWGIGDAERNDGVLVIISRGDREMHISLGRAYDVVWDGRAQRAIDTGFLPDFRNDRYAAGIEAGAIAVVDLIARPFFDAQSSPNGAAARPVTEKQAAMLERQASRERTKYFLIGAAVLGGLGLALRHQLARLFLPWKKCKTCGKRGHSYRSEIVTPAVKFANGVGVRHVTCKSCGEDHKTQFTIPGRDRPGQGRGGGSSGFGGGRSSGGGASGKW